MADTINAWGWDVAAKSLKITAADYESETGAAVTVSQMGQGNMNDKFKSSLLSGSGAPACAMMEDPSAPAWVGTDGLRDISGWIDEAGLKDKFVSGKWTPLQDDSGVYGLPWDIGPVGLFYRRDLLEQNGIDPTTIETWDQLIEEGKKLPEGTGMLNIPSNDYDGLWRMQFRQLGGQPFTEDGYVNIHSEKSVQVAQTLKRLYDSGITADKPPWTKSWFTALGDGSIASLMNGAWMLGTLKAEVGDTKGKWGVIKPPAFESGGPRATNSGGSNMTIAKQVSDAKARRAWDFMEFSLATKEMQTEIYSEYGIFPAYKPAYESDIFSSEIPFLGGQKAGELFTEVAENIPGYRYTTATSEVTKAINTHLGRMFDGKVTPKKAVTNAAEQVAKRTDRKLA
ncbi:extracellular solute-binding protein (plasmid) [Haloferax prahovense]|uniref:extracellular solute-binding protein n=1 Tax=Haloferax prahovense TaxID=381852 RepID=UPI003C74B085